MTKQPRLLQLVEFERDQGGSFTPMLTGVLSAARDAGWEVGAVFFETVAEHPWVEEFESLGIPLLLAPDALRGSRRGLRDWLISQLDAEQPTVLHTHFTKWDIPAVMAARRTRASVVWHVHSALPRDPLVVARTVFKFGAIGRDVAAILCPAPNIVEGVKLRLGPRARVHLLPSAIDVETFRPPRASERGAGREAIGARGGELALMHFGWHTHLKGTDLFLEALQKVSIRFGDRVVGFERGGGEEALAMGREMGVESRLRILGPVPDARSLHYGADLLVQSSREEGMAYAVIEALACGTPVVATEIPGHKMIGDQVANCAVVAIDSGAIAEGIITMLSRPRLQAIEDAIETRRWVVENLSIAAVSAQLLKVYEGSLPS